MSIFSNNIEKLRLKLSGIEGHGINQASFSQRLGVGQSAYSKWVQGKHGEEAYLRLAKFVNEYFRTEPPIQPKEVAEFEIWELILERGEGLRDEKPVDKKSFSRWSLNQLLQDKPLVRMLAIDGALQQRMAELVDGLRGDLDKEDWAAVARMLREGRDADLWMYQDAERYKVPVFFKTDRRLTDQELARFNRDVLDKVLDEYVKKLREEEKKK